MDGCGILREACFVDSVCTQGIACDDFNFTYNSLISLDVSLKDFLLVYIVLPVFLSTALPMLHCASQL